MTHQYHNFVAAAEPEVSGRLYALVHSRVLLLAFILVGCTAAWQGRVYLQQRTVNRLMSEPAVATISLPPAAEGHTIIAKATNRVAKIVLDADTAKVVEWNYQAEQLLGWKAADVVDSRMDFLLPNLASLERHQKLLQDENVRKNMLANTLQLTCWIYQADGTPKQFRVRARGWLDDRYYLICEVEDQAKIMELTTNSARPPDKHPN